MCRIYFFDINKMFLIINAFIRAKMYDTLSDIYNKILKRKI